MYTIKTHDGKSLSIKQNDPEKIKELARALELTAVTLSDNSIIFLSKGTVARLERTSGMEADSIKDSTHILDRPDHRGKYSPAKEVLRKQYGS